MAQVLQIRHKGLHTSANEFSAIPDGSLLRADNCILTVDNILEPRRGRFRAATLPLTTDRISRQEFYQDQMVVNYTGGKIGYLTAGTEALPGTFTALTGTFNHPSATLARTKFLLTESNLYFTTDGGVYRMDAYNATPVLSGIPKGLDISLALSGSSGFMSTANQVAYRVVWGIRDANSTLRLGAPSGRAIIINSTGGTRDIAVVFTVPSAISGASNATSYFYQVYRSAQSGAVDVTPDDELGLIQEANYTSGSTISFTDRTTDDLRGATLYTSASQEGIAQSNERPPLADDIEEFQGCTIYANTLSKHRKTFTVLACTGTGGIDYTNTITIAGTTYTYTGTEDTATGKVALYGSRNVNVTKAINAVSTLTMADTSKVRVGSRVYDADLTYTNIAIDTFVGSIVTNTSIALVDAAGASKSTNITAASTFSATFYDGTPAQNIQDTANSLVRVINRYATNTLVYAYYLSGPDDLPGQILIEERGVGGASFALTASANGSAYSPVLPTTGTSISSTNDDFQNALMFSKSSKGEAVPLLNVLRVGSANTAIRRIKKLRNSLFIFKEREGIYRMTGTDPTNFIVELFDSSAKLLAPDTVEVVNNQVWALCDQGVVVVTETGVSVVSRPIEDLILDQFGSALTAAKYYSHGYGYETERQYILNTVSTSADTVATQAFVFNIFTQSFTKWPESKSCAKVSPVDDLLYLGDGDSYYLEQERKTRDYTDYVDYRQLYTLVSQSTYDITLTSTNEIEAGDMLYQSATVQSLITDVQPGYVTVQDSLTWAAGDVYVYKGLNCVVEYSAVTGENPGMSKQFPEISMLFKAARFYSATLSFATDASASFEDVTILGNRTGLWGLFPWGQAAWGGTATTLPIRTFVPTEKQRGSLLRVRLTHRQAFGYFKSLGFALVYRDVSPKVAK